MAIEQLQQELATAKHEVEVVKSEARQVRKHPCQSGVAASVALCSPRAACAPERRARARKINIMRDSSARSQLLRALPCTATARSCRVVNSGFA